jgi:glucans biosynthesis protein
MMRLLQWIFIFTMASGISSSGAERVRIDFNHVCDIAEKLARKPYHQKWKKLPRELRELSYDQYKDIRFLSEKALWYDDEMPFRVEFFHLGGLYQQSIEIHEFSKTHSQRVPYVTDFFDYGDNQHMGRFSRSLGFAGLKVLNPLNRPTHYDELISFLGTSYFRALGVDQRYGISARGIAVNTGLGRPEEFPASTKFWIRKPEKGDEELLVYALLNGPSLSGAYQFRIRPGETTEMEVTTSVFLRQAIESLGLAPLTSMYWFGENSRSGNADFRPEVHDSDGLSIKISEEKWIWRPLDNPKETRLTDFPVKDPLGFGLIQRDRRFNSYQDLEAHYQLRPSLWVEPIDGWGAGIIRLVELPTKNEYMDNIVAFWIPKKELKPGERVDISYRLHWAMNSENLMPKAWVESTRVGSVSENPLEKLFVIDFVGEEMAMADDDAFIEAVVRAGNGAQIISAVSQKNRPNRTWRVAIRAKADQPGGTIELYCHLKIKSAIVSETWTYRWTP